MKFLREAFGIGERWGRLPGGLAFKVRVDAGIFLRKNADLPSASDLVNIDSGILFNFQDLELRYPHPVCDARKTGNLSDGDEEEAIYLTQEVIDSDSDCRAHIQALKRRGYKVFATHGYKLHESTGSDYDNSYTERGVILRIAKNKK